MENSNHAKGTLWLIHKNTERGLLLKTLLPQLGEQFRKGKTVTVLVKEHHQILIHKDKFVGISANGLKMAIGYALGGYDGKFHDSESFSYSGLLAKEEYLAIRDEHWKLRSKQISKNAGNTPFEDEEISLMNDLIKKPENLKQGKPDLSKIADIMNETFHQDDKPRTGKRLATFRSKEKAKARRRELQLQEA